MEAIRKEIQLLRLGTADSQDVTGNARIIATPCSIFSKREIPKELKSKKQ